MGNIRKLCIFILFIQDLLKEGFLPKLAVAVLVLLEISHCILMPMTYIYKITTDFYPLDMYLLWKMWIFHRTTKTVGFELSSNMHIY